MNIEDKLKQFIDMPQSTLFTEQDGDFSLGFRMSSSATVEKNEKKDDASVEKDKNKDDFDSLLATGSTRKMTSTPDLLKQVEVLFSKLGG
jgi:hypothetical protein